MFAERNTTGNRTPVQPLNSFSAYFQFGLEKVGEYKRQVGRFSSELWRWLLQQEEEFLWRYPRHNA